MKRQQLFERGGLVYLSMFFLCQQHPLCREAVRNISWNYYYHIKDVFTVITFTCWRFSFGKFLRSFRGEAKRKMCQGRWPNFQPLWWISYDLEKASSSFIDDTQASPLSLLLLIFSGFCFSARVLRHWNPLCDLNTFFFCSVKWCFQNDMSEKQNRWKWLMGMFSCCYSNFHFSSGLNSLQIKIQASPATSISSLSELSPLSSENVANSPSTSSSQSTTDLNDPILTGRSNLTPL